MDVVVLGATGRFASLVPTLAAAGHQVRAATRDPGGARGRWLREAGVQVVRVDLDEPDTIERAARGADAVFFAGTAHRAGPAGDVAHGRNVIGAVRAARVRHLVYVSVAGADQPSQVPLLESKRQVEQYLAASGVPFTIVAPVYLMDNLWNPWNLPVGRFPSPVPPTRSLQQVPLGDVVEFAAYALGHREQVPGLRIEIASDELTAVQAAGVVAGLTGRRLEVDAQVAGGPVPLFRWLDRVGYSIDIDRLRERFPEVGWRRFAEWAKTQDWSAVTGPDR